MSNFESEMKNSNRVNKLKNEKVRFWLNVGEKNYPKKGEKLRTKLYENLFWKWVVSLDCQTKNVTEKDWLKRTTKSKRSTLATLHIKL